MGKVLGIYKITLGENTDAEQFKFKMTTSVMTKLDVGNRNRGGIIESQDLWKQANQNTPNIFEWHITWLEQGGSPFGSFGRPQDPSAELGDLDVVAEYQELRPL